MDKTLRTMKKESTNDILYSFQCSKDSFERKRNVDFSKDPKPAEIQAGVYAWRIKDKQIYVRIGKSESNVLARARQHINGAYPNGYTYKILSNAKKELKKKHFSDFLELDLYILKKDTDSCFIASLESFLETNNNPIIPSGTRNPNQKFNKTCTKKIQQSVRNL